ncbi:MAG TPA: peptidase S41, partial [Planctomycetota bacterium]|nr:peptidase S41 [Planctomycetota bacterium]
MWIGDRIWFASDRTGTLNLWSCDPSGGTPEQATFSKEWDVRWPGASPDGRIVYELGGRLHVFDTRTRADLPLSIWVPDDGVARRPSSIRVEGNIESFGLGPTGTRALFVARGEVFTVPTEHGAVRNLTRSPGAHDREAAWSPDGEHVAFLSDADGEEEIWIARADGSEKPRQLTDGGSERRHGLLWAPGARRIAFGDKSGRILVADVESGEVVLVADNPTGATSDYAWSPDGRWLAFSLAEENENSSLWIWSAEDATLHRVTDERFNEHSPAWSRDGKYLFYLSDREFAPQISSIEWNFAVDRETAVFVLALRRDVEHPFPPKSDEEKARGEEASKASKDDERGGKDDAGDDEGGSEAEAADASETGEAENASPDDKPRVDIDFDGLAQRVARV